MRKSFSVFKHLSFGAFLLCCLLVFNTAQSQQISFKDFVLYSGVKTELSSSTSVTGGAVVSQTLIKTTGSSSLNASLHSGGKIELANSNTVDGVITAAANNGTVVQIGSNAKINNKVDANGNIVIAGGVVKGPVTYPTGFSYFGPRPTNGATAGTPSIPSIPTPPAINNFTITGTRSITKTEIISPGNYLDLAPTGNQTITFSGAGSYFFNSIKNSGNFNTYTFDLRGETKALIRIFVKGDVDLYKLNVTFKNGGDASQVYMEVHGTGSTAADRVSAWSISNGASGNTRSIWQGTVYAPNGSINIGQGSSESKIIGALWSGKEIKAQSGVGITYKPLMNDQVIFPFNPSPQNGKVTGLIGAELTSLAQGTTDEAKKLLVIIDGYVLIEVIAKQGKEAEVLNYLTSNGMTGIISNGSNSLITTGKFPIANLTALNSRIDIINFVRPVFAPVVNIGLIQNAGDKAMGANLVRNGYNLQGEGIRIGVLSDSYNSLATPINNPAEVDVATKELPGASDNPINTTPVQVLLDYPYFPRSDEGRAMLQVIHDIAPKAKLSFRTGFISPGDFAVGIQQLKDAQCNVIVDDITYITEPFLRDGMVAKAVDAVKAAGVTYISAAGNFSNKSYQAKYNATTAPAGFPAGTTAHAFGPGDVYQKLKLKPGSYTIVLQWDDDIYSIGQTQTGGTKNDFDIYLTDVNNNNIICGFNRVNISGDPIEVLAYTVSPNVTEVEANLLITRANVGTPSPDFKLVIFRGEGTFMEYSSGGSTIVGQANAAGALTVGAVNYFRTPAFNGTPVIATYSSQGGTLVNGSINRNKPDLSAPDGVNTSVTMSPDLASSFPEEEDPFSNFFGTSAAAPNVAGVAALLIEGRKKFKNETLSPDGLKTLLQTTALPFGDAKTAGAGLIQGDAAMRTFAAPTPSLISLEYPTSITPATPPTASFTLTVHGDYLLPSSKVIFRDVALTTTYVNSTTLTAVVPAFTGNPTIKVYTEPIANGDGGYSNSIAFFSIPKKLVTVKANSAEKKYGEKLPDFSSEIKVNGVLLSQSGLTLQDLGLETLTYATNATTLSNVGNQYFIKPVRKFDLTNQRDLGLTEIYTYDTIPGILSILKLPVTVTPEDQAIDYGQYPTNITFKYTFDRSKMTDANAVMNIIKNSHESAIPNNALAVISNASSLTDANLTNLAAMSSYQSIINARKFELTNGQLVPATNLNSFNLYYLVDISAESVLQYHSNPTSNTLIVPYTGISSRAMLNAAALASGNSKVSSNGNLVQMVNGNLVQLVNGAAGQQLPIVNGNLVQLVNGNLVQLVNGVYQPIPNTGKVQLLNGNLVQLVNNEWVVIPNGNLVQLVNGTLVQMVNGNLVQLVNGNLVQLVNGNLVQIVNGNLVQLVNGVQVPVANGNLVQLVNGNLVQLVNGNLVQMVNGQVIPLDSGVQIVNGNLVQLVNASTPDAALGNTGVIIDAQDVLNGGIIGVMSSVNMVTGLTSGDQKLVPGALPNSNLLVTYGFGKLKVNKLVVTIKANDLSRPYGESNPELTVTYSGLAPGQDLQSSGVSGTPSVTTAAVATSPVGAYPITVASGTLASANHTFTFVNGTLTVTNNPCLITHSPFTNFGSTSNPGKATSLWVNIVTKVSGQLVANGDYLVFKGGTITLNNISSTPAVTDAAIPNGKIIADMTISVPITSYDASTNTWITKVPLRYSSTSDIFITGAIINSSSGFAKKNNANSVVRGVFYSNKSFSDQWAYAIAAYQPTFTYASVAAPGQVVSVNGQYKAGTPVPQISYLVNGGSGGGGNNYTGSSSSFDKYTVCLPANSRTNARISNNLIPAEEEQTANDINGIQITPNPASHFIDVSFTIQYNGLSKIVMYSLDGKKVIEVNNGMGEAGKKYKKRVDVSKLIDGIYLIQLIGRDILTTEKVIISK